MSSLKHIIYLTLFACPTKISLKVSSNVKISQFSWLMQLLSIKTNINRHKVSNFSLFNKLFKP